jgi:aryl-alcohol dehydrogenase-like predicted oxidoreductase
MTNDTNAETATDAIHRTTIAPAHARGTFLIGGDLPVHRVGFGAMRLPMGRFGDPARDPEKGAAVLRRAIELGVDHIDTADFYAVGDVRSNAVIREALTPYPAGLVIATKVGPLRDATGGLAGQATADQLPGLVEDNLRALGVDRLDLVYLRVGGMTGPGGESVAERFAVLAELRRAGVIRHLGVSNVDVEQFEEARSVAPVAAVQNHFSVAQQGDTELLTRCTELGIAFVPFFPIGGGFQPLDSPALAAVATRHGATPAQIAQAWLLGLAPNMLLIPGTGSLEHLEENVAAAGIELSAADLAELGGR